MRWFRDHIRNGAWLALIALAINLGLAFGHVHALDIGRVERGLLAATQTSPDGNQRQGHPVDSQADYLCPICMAAGALANAVAATPPALQVEFAYAPVDRAIPAALVLIRPQHAAFQSRGPPLS
jgi:hypothetical protein